MTAAMAPTGRVVLITGASSGIGAATARRFQADGWRVFGTSRRAATGTVIDGVESIALDVTDDLSVAAAVEHVLGHAASSTC